MSPINYATYVQFQIKDEMRDEQFDAPYHLGIHVRNYIICACCGAILTEDEVFYTPIDLAQDWIDIEELVGFEDWDHE